ncbi:MAG: fimbrillin family protein [Bacteroidales bacterium]|nr:fimbrillin family protein [Bacteroidales bacterium]
MKKVFLIAAAVVALAACSKNEVLPSSSINNEISFNVAPRTKALATDQSAFGVDNHFISYAYFLTDDKKWPTNAGSIYINGAEVSSHVDASATGGRVWKADNSYYWPKSEKSSLTFFAWSKNTGECGLAGGATVSCHPQKGIAFTGYDVTSNKNVDLLVADVAANKTRNENLYTYSGVPTLFRHKLSYVIFKVKTQKAYAGKEFALKSIKFVGLGSKASYDQKANDGTDPVYNTVGEWATPTATADQVYFNATTPVVFTDADFVLETAATASVDQKYYLPQALTAVTPGAGVAGSIEVVYTIKTTEGAAESTETVTRYISAKSMFADDLKINKKYTCTLTFSLDEITWDPAVQDWDPVTAADITIQ